MWKCYSSTLSLTSALDGVDVPRHASAALPVGKTRYALCRRLGVPQDRSGRLRKISPSLGFDPRNRIWVGTLKDGIDEEDLEDAGK
jgi:hypothetical protein